MTLDNKAVFSKAFSSLARCCRAFSGQSRESDAKASMASYFTALMDVPIDPVIEAANRLARTATRMPAAGEWHEKAASIATERAAGVAQATRSRPPRDNAEREGIRQARREFYRGWNALRVGSGRKPFDLDEVDRMSIALPRRENCTLCSDTGWITRLCPGAYHKGRHWCGRTSCSDGHTFAMRCRCQPGGEARA